MNAFAAYVVSIRPEAHAPSENGAPIEVQHEWRITSQLDPPHWHEHIGDPTIADAILDRVVHRAYKMKLLGPSKRRTEEEKASSKPAEASN